MTNRTTIIGESGRQRRLQYFEYRRVHRKERYISIYIIYNIMSTSNTAHKKAQMEVGDGELEDFDALRRYLLQGPFAVDHPAVSAALHGMDQEVKRRHRDAKLRQRFATTASTQSAATDDCGDDAVQVERPSLKTSFPKDDDESMMMMTDDWHDVTAEEDAVHTLQQQQHEKMEHSHGGGYLGALWAKEAVASLAAHQVLCQSPQGALAVAFHAALLQAGFDCTGVPETEPTVGGFAAPIRKLPPDQFLPSHWEKPADIELRYRSEATGSIVLTVASVPGTSEPEVQVSLTPTLRKEPTTSAWQFAVADHINLDSWNRARKNNQDAIPPALHYKALASLFTKFAQQFHLGTVEDCMDRQSQPLAEAAASGAAAMDSQYVDHTMLHNRRQNMDYATTTSDAVTQHDPSTAMATAPSVDLWKLDNNRQRPFQPAPAPDVTLADPFPQPFNMRFPNPDRSVSHEPPGDFSGDLTPTGMFPYPHNMPGTTAGNLMGPNHPMFHHNNGSGGTSGLGPPGGGGFGMQPRFDPFGPPGGPTEPEDPDPDHRRNPNPPDLRRPGGTGNPNNDLERLPSLNNNNLFS